VARWTLAGIKNKFPVLKIILPVSSPKIPCCDLQGISSKVAELSADSMVIHAAWADSGEIPCIFPC
jgi:hypothetical protein